MGATFYGAMHSVLGCVRQPVLGVPAGTGTAHVVTLGAVGVEQPAEDLASESSQIGSIPGRQAVSVC
jgi:hypothetical protein